jgi:hypothetical protein
LVDEECKTFNCHQFFGELMLDFSWNIDKDKFLDENINISFEQAALFVSSCPRKDRKKVAYYRYLTHEQMKNLCGRYGSHSFLYRFENLISASKLTYIQVIRFIRTDIREIIRFIEERLNQNNTSLTDAQVKYFYNISSGGKLPNIRKFLERKLEHDVEHTLTSPSQKRIYTLLKL